ncbi:MAG: tetratricopeptide repeat protein [bacterium]
MRRFLICLLLIGLSINVWAQDEIKIYDQAVNSFNKGDFNEANKFCQKYLDLHPSGEKVSDIQLLSAECEYQLRNFLNAAMLFEKVADLYPGLEMAKQALSRAGESFQKLGDYAGAKRAFTKIKTRYPDTPDANYAEYNLSELEKYLPSKSVTATATTQQPTIQQTETEEELLQKAKASYEAKDYQQAISLFRDFLTKFKTSNFAHYAQLKISESFYYQNKFEEALKEYKKVITNYPESKYIDYCLYSIGWCQYRLENDQEAIASFEKLIKEYPKSKYVDSSQKAIEKIKAEYEEKQAKELLDQANSLYADKKYKESKEKITRLINKYPDSKLINEAKGLLSKINEDLVVTSYKEARTIYDRGEVALRQKNYDEAIHEFKRVMFEFPESEYAKLAEKAMTLIEEEKDYLQAKKKWEESTKLYEEEKLAKAKEGFKEIVTEYPKTEYKEDAQKKLLEIETKESEDEAYKIYKKGLTLMKEKSYPLAINTFQQIITNYPNTEYATLAQSGINEAEEAMKTDRVKRKFDIALRYYALGDYKSATEWFEEIKENYPNTEYAKKSEENLVAISKKGTPKSAEEEYNLALRLYEQGNLQDAALQFKKIIDTYPDTKFANTSKELLTTAENKLKDEQSKVLYDTARRTQEYGEYNSAITQYDKLINEYPDSYWSPYAIYGKAETFYAMGEFDKAKEQWQKVADNFPASDLVPHALYHIAECEEQAGEYQKAALIYEKLQKTYPTSIYGKGELSELIKDKIALLKGKIPR